MAIVVLEVGDEFVLSAAANYVPALGVGDSLLNLFLKNNF